MPNKPNEVMGGDRLFEKWVDCGANEGIYNKTNFLTDIRTHDQEVRDKAGHDWIDLMMSMNIPYAVCFKISVEAHKIGLLKTEDQSLISEDKKEKSNG